MARRGLGPLRKHGERAIQTGERQTYELANDLPGRPPFVRQWTIVPLSGSDGLVDQLLVMSEDVTAQRHLVDELLAGPPQRASSSRVLSHELRNPLAPITNSLHVIDRTPAGGDQSESAARARAVDPPAGSRSWRASPTTCSTSRASP